MIIAIQPDNYGVGDASSPLWKKFLESSGHEVRWVDVRRADILEQIKGCDGFMWRHAHFDEMHLIAKRLLPVIEKELGLIVYPDQKTSWHYDDKITQAFLFDALDIPTPKTWVWFNRKDAHEWATQTNYPVVLKLFSGAGSSNVKLIQSKDEAHQWINRLFGTGTNSPNENDFSLKSRLMNALAIIADKKSHHEIHHGYAYFQEFLPDNDYDTRVTIIGNRAFAFRRFNRPNDFRASGSGIIDYNTEHIDEKFIRLAFTTANQLHTQSCAIDGVWKGGTATTVEVSYTYVSKVIFDCPGHWELNGHPETGDLIWIEGHMNPEEAQIIDYLTHQKLAKLCQT
ncbi:MAG: hypothetical protein COA75_01545 [Cellvibrionales bacterium]|nr:MAG: hypothetical protein COA75_01545 [Cellvibrionales bacterium]